MKRTILGFLLVLCCQLSFGQGLPDFASIKLDKKEDFNAAANDAALKAANYLLSTPLDGSNIERLRSLQYLVKWMTGSPEFTFNLDDEAAKLSKKNEDVMGLYIAAMSKYALEHREDAGDQKKVKLNAVRTLVNYAKDPANNVKLNGELKKVMEAEEKGQLAEYLKV